jgi:hypothetical protein
VFRLRPFHLIFERGNAGNEPVGLVSTCLKGGDPRTESVSLRRVERANWGMALGCFPLAHLFITHIAIAPRIAVKRDQGRTMAQTVRPGLRLSLAGGISVDRSAITLSESDESGAKESAAGL